MIIVQKAVIKKGDKFLILLRSPTAKFFPEHWDFPGGKLEEGEGPLKGVEREVLEEIGIKVVAKKVLASYEMILNGISYRFTVYSTQIKSGDVKISHEHSDFKWATKEEILDLKIEPFMHRFFAE